MSDAYATLLERVKESGRLEAGGAPLDWGPGGYMPKGGGGARAVRRRERRARGSISIA